MPLQGRHEYIRNLNAMRGVAALSIFVMHFCRDDRFEFLGWLPVAFFFCLSGFLLSARRSDSRRPLPGAGAFFLSHFLKLFPLYVAGELIMIALGTEMPSWDYVLAVLSGTRTWFGFRYMFHGNLYAWFICSLFACYLCFVPLLRLQRSYPRLFRILAVTAALGAGTLIVTVGPAHLYYLCYSGPMPCIAVFMLGMFAAQLRPHVVIPDTMLKSSLVELGFLLFFVALIIALPRIPRNIAMALYWWLPVMMLVLALYALDGSRGFLTRMLHSFPMQEMGRISYSFFIFQYPWFCLTTDFQRAFLPSLPDYLYLAVSLALYIPLAWLINRYVEIPVARVLSGAKNGVPGPARQ